MRTSAFSPKINKLMKLTIDGITLFGIENFKNKKSFMKYANNAIAIVNKDPEYLELLWNTIQKIVSPEKTDDAK